MEAEGGLDDGGIEDDDDEPQLAQPARKKARTEPTRKSRRGAAAEKRVPPLRGQPREKPKRPLMADLSPKAADARRKEQHGYDKNSYDKKQPSWRVHRLTRAQRQAKSTRTLLLLVSEARREPWIR